MGKKREKKEKKRGDGVGEGVETASKSKGGKEERRIWPALVSGTVFWTLGAPVVSKRSSGFSGFELTTLTREIQYRRTRAVHDLAVLKTHYTLVK